MADAPVTARSSEAVDEPSVDPLGNRGRVGLEERGDFLAGEEGLAPEASFGSRQAGELYQGGRRPSCSGLGANAASGSRRRRIRLRKASQRAD